MGPKVLDDAPVEGVSRPAGARVPRAGGAADRSPPAADAGHSAGTGLDEAASGGAAATRVSRLRKHSAASLRDGVLTHSSGASVDIGEATSERAGTGLNRRRVAAAVGASIALFDIVLQHPPHPLAPLVLTACGLWFIHDRAEQRRARADEAARFEGRGSGHGARPTQRQVHGSEHVGDDEQGTDASTTRP